LGAVLRYADAALVTVCAFVIAAAAFDAVTHATVRTAWFPVWYTRIGFRLAGQPNSGQRHSGQAEPESPEGLPPRDRLSHSFGQLIEFVIHHFLRGCLPFFRANERTVRDLAQRIRQVVTALSSERILEQVTSLTRRDDRIGLPSAVDASCSWMRREDSPAVAAPPGVR
jgi:hypothetical protein